MHTEKLSLSAYKNYFYLQEMPRISPTYEVFEALSMTSPFIYDPYKLGEVPHLKL